jgi:hypothetical protein
MNCAAGMNLKDNESNQRCIKVEIEVFRDKD